MSYRDEREALRQRVEELEKELAETKDALEGRAATTPKSNPLIGGPTRIVVERVLEGELDEETVADLVGKLREHVGEVGRLERVGSSIAWSTTGRAGRYVEMTVERTERGTVLRVTEPLNQMIGSLFGGLLGGLGGGGVIIPMMPMFFGLPDLLPFTIVGWISGVYLATRAIYKSRSRKRQVALEALADRLVARAAKTAEPPVRARVEAVDDGEEVEELEAAVTPEREREA